MLPRLGKLLRNNPPSDPDLIAVDERAHHSFYRQVVQLFLELERPGMLEQLRRVMHDFEMPAVLADSRQRVAAICVLNIFDGQMYIHHVYQPILDALGVKRSELRRLSPTKRGRTRVNWWG